MSMGFLLGWTLALLGATGAAASSGPIPDPVLRGRFLMGAVCQITAYGDDPGDTARSLEAALDAIEQAEALLSTWREDTELARVNRAAAKQRAALSPELAAFVGRVLALAATTQGAFDPTVGALIDAWDLRGDGRVPSPGALRDALASVGFRRVELDGGVLSVRFHAPGLWLDTGAAGKGYALDLAADVLRGHGLASFLLDFGGQVLAAGAPPGRAAWSVAVADPGHRSEPALILSLRDSSVATSSQWERGRQIGGRWIGHILDPRSGEPVAWRGSATVVAASALEADALATGLFVMGPGDGLAWASTRKGVGLAYLSAAAGPEAGRVLELHANETLEAVLSDTRDDVVRPTVHRE
jgi:thiamine biosynthesis lipoprotein